MSTIKKHEMLKTWRKAESRRRAVKKAEGIWPVYEPAAFTWTCSLMLQANYLMVDTGCGDRVCEIAFRGEFRIREGISAEKGEGWELVGVREDTTVWGYVLVCQSVGFISKSYWAQSVCKEGSNLPLHPSHTNRIRPGHDLLHANSIWPPFASLQLSPSPFPPLTHPHNRCTLTQTHTSPLQVFLCSLLLIFLIWSVHCQSFD